MDFNYYTFLQICAANLFLLRDRGYGQRCQKFLSEYHNTVDFQRDILKNDPYTNTLNVQNGGVLYKIHSVYSSYTQLELRPLLIRMQHKMTPSTISESAIL